MLHRPTLLFVPGFAARIALGEFAGEVLGGQRAIPTKLTGAGYAFAHTDLDRGAARRAHVTRCVAIRGPSRVSAQLEPQRRRSGARRRCRVARPRHSSREAASDARSRDGDTSRVAADPQRRVGRTRAARGRSRPARAGRATRCRRAAVRRAGKPGGAAAALRVANAWARIASRRSSAGEHRSCGVGAGVAGEPRSSWSCSRPGAATNALAAGPVTWRELCPAAARVAMRRCRPPGRRCGRDPHRAAARPPAITASTRAASDRARRVPNRPGGCAGSPAAAAGRPAGSAAARPDRRAGSARPRALERRPRGISALLGGLVRVPGPARASPTRSDAGVAAHREPMCAGRAACRGPTGRSTGGASPPGRELDGERVAAVPQIEGEVGCRAPPVRIDRQRPTQHCGHRRPAHRPPRGERATSLEPTAAPRGRALPAAVAAGQAGCPVSACRATAAEHEDVARRSRAHTRPRPPDRCRRAWSGRRHVTGESRDPDIGKERRTVGEEQDVRRADVAVDDSVSVQVRQRRTDRSHRGDHLTRREPAARAKQLRQRPAVGEIEHQHAGVAGRDQRVQPHQVRMIELGEQRGLGADRVARPARPRSGCASGRPARRWRQPGRATPRRTTPRPSNCSHHVAAQPPRIAADRPRQRR